MENTVEEQRPTPLVDDLEATRARLAAWLSAQRGYPVTVSDLSIPESSGMSNVTLLFDTEWEEDGEPRVEACVGRLQPEVERPVFPEYDLGMQYHIMQGLGAHSDVPVPALRGLELDPQVLGVPFYIMRKTEGRIPTDMPPYNMDGWMMHDTSLGQREQLWNAGLDAMASIHRLDYRVLGFDFLDGEGNALRRQLDYWHRYHDWAMEGERHQICSAALDWLEAQQPEQEVTGLCWGDARIGNIIFTPDCSTVAAVLDWEMATLGNPVQDLAWYCYIDSTFAEGLGMPRLEGLPSYADSITRWQRSTGLPIDHYDYYNVFAGMRYGLILSRVMLCTDQRGEVQGNFACQLLARTLEAMP